jgi:recombination protein RecA
MPSILASEPLNKATVLKQAIDQINKAYGAGSIWSALETDIPKTESVSTSSYTLDKALGIGGLPKGRITEIFGPESTGKTTLALHVIANVQAQGGTAAIIDVEHAIDLNYAKALGVNVGELLVSQPDTGEQALEIAESLVRGQVDCVVLDSVAMLIPEAEIKGGMSDMQMGAQPRLIGKALRKLTAPISNANCVFILINQIRMTMTMYGNPETTPGGRSLKYMSSVRIDLRKKDFIKTGDNVRGILVGATVVKNKLAPPSKKAEFEIYFGKGIDKMGGLVDAAVLAGIFTRTDRGGWYRYGDIVLGAGKEKTVEKLLEDPALLREVESKL